MDRSRAELLLNAEDPPDAAERGVSYEFLERLLRKQKLGELTTREVVKQYVVPQTFNSKCSLSGLLRQIHPQSVGRATHYVVHPWDGSFERLVRALGAVDGSHDDEEGNPPYFWIDVFALNQRQQVEGYKREEDAWLHRDEMFSQLRHCMRTIDKTCVIVDPVLNPIVLKRSWCMFEVGQALQQRRDVMLCPVPEPPDCDPFLDVVSDFENTIAHYEIKFSKCDTTIPVDKEWLEKEVLSLSPLGEKWLNENVGQEFLGWLADRAAGRVMAQSYSSPTPEETPLAPEVVAKRLLLMQSLSNLLSSLDRADMARDILEKALERAQDEFGPEDDRSLSMRHDLACLCAKSFGELRKSDQQLRQILALRRERYGEEHELVVETMEALGRVLKERRKLTEAISLFRKVLAIRENTLGPSHPQTLVILNLLALTLQKREQYKEAEEVFRRVVSAGIDTLGATNLDVMVWSNNLAVLYQDTKQLDKAEVLLRTTLRNAEHALGPTHPHTLTLVFNLGYCLWHQGRDRAAEGFFRRELAGCEATKGPSHRDTQRSRQNLARLIATQAGREKEAEAILKGESLARLSDGTTSSANSSPSDEAPPQAGRRVGVMNPEVQVTTISDDSTTIRHSHLLAAAAGLSALPPPRGVGGARTSSAEWSDAGALPRDVVSPYGFRTSTASPVTSDGDDRTADDATASLGRGEEDELDHFHHEDGEHEEEEGSEGLYDDGGTEEGADDYEGEEDEEEEEDEDDVHHYHDDDYESGSKEDYSEEEDVEEFQEHSIKDSVRHPARGRGNSQGRQRREQTVTSDDELLAEQFREVKDGEDLHTDEE